MPDDFANVVLADEKKHATQYAGRAARGEQEHRSRAGAEYRWRAFFVFATRNIELEGTYPLPEAQIDRFMFEIIIDYLTEDQEVDVVRATTSLQRHRFERAVTGADIVAFQELVRRVPAAEPVARYAVNLARASRPGPVPDFVKVGCRSGGVRATQHLTSRKKRASHAGRFHVLEDIRGLAKPVMRHRIIRNFHANRESNHGQDRRQCWSRAGSKAGM